MNRRGLVEAQGLQGVGRGDRTRHVVPFDVGSVTFSTLASYPESGADVNGRTGLSNATDMNVANVARLWIYAALEAIAFDGLATVNSAPSPGALATRIAPPCASTTWRTIHSPRPSPP